MILLGYGDVCTGENKAFLVMILVDSLHNVCFFIAAISYSNACELNPPNPQNLC
jgi:hypothetical protein